MAVRKYKILRRVLGGRSKQKGEGQKQRSCKQRRNTHLLQHKRMIQHKNVGEQTFSEKHNPKNMFLLLIIFHMVAESPKREPRRTHRRRGEEEAEAAQRSKPGVEAEAQVYIAIWLVLFYVLLSGCWSSAGALVIFMKDAKMSYNVFLLLFFSELCFYQERSETYVSKPFFASLPHHWRQIISEKEKHKANVSSFDVFVFLVFFYLFCIFLQISG